MAENFDSFLLQRSLDYLIPEILRAEYPEITVDADIPISNEGGPGADTISQLTIEYYGRAKITTSPTDDPPMIGINSNGLNSSVVRSLTAAFDLHFQEARAAEMMGVNVSAEKGMAAKETVERESARIAYLGDSESGIHGLFTFPYLPKIISSVRFDNPAADPNLLLDSINSWSNVLYDVLTRKTIQANAVLMPTRVYTKLSTTYRNSNSDTTLMELWRKANPHITYVNRVPEADEAGFGGTPAMIFYKKDPMHVRRHIPQPTEVLVHRESETSKTMLVHQRTGGTFFRRLSGVIVEGVLG